MMFLFKILYSSQWLPEPLPWDEVSSFRDPRPQHSQAMYEDPSWSLASVFPGPFTGKKKNKKTPLNMLYGLVPERSALFSVKRVLE